MEPYGQPFLICLASYLSEAISLPLVDDEFDVFD